MKLTLTALMIAAGALTITLTAQAGDLPAASTKTGVTYDTDIKPIFAKSCEHCHSGEKPKAKLKLDSLAGILKGSRNGKVVSPGDSAKSLLVQAAAHTTEDTDLYMPPEKAVSKYPTLTAEQIGLVRAWIDQGAK